MKINKIERKKLMKKILFFCLVFFAEVIAQTGYTVELKKTFCDWHVAKAFQDTVKTTIMDTSGNVIQPSNNFYYEYHINTNGNLDTIGGFRKNKCGLDNDINLIQTWYVIVKDSVNHTFCDTSNMVSFQMEENPSEAKNVIPKVIKKMVT